MKFRKFFLCLLAGLLILGFPGIHTYAAEDTSVTNDGSVTVNTDADLNNTTDTEIPVQTGEEGVIEDTSGDGAAVEEDGVVEETIEVEEGDSETSSDSKEGKDTQASGKKTAKVKYTKSELRLLSALIYCEAGGESYQGKLAVGIVVMNRKRSGSYPDSVKAVIYQKYQFGPASNGSLASALAEYDKGNFTSANEKESIKAAKAALTGTKTIQVNGKKKDFSKYLFFSCSMNNYTFQLGNHKFK